MKQQYQSPCVKVLQIGATAILAGSGSTEQITVGGSGPSRVRGAYSGLWDEDEE